MFFNGKHGEVVYILVSIKIHVGKDMYSGHQVCGVLDYNTGTWWNYDDDKITNYLVYPENIYDSLSNGNEQNRGGNFLS